MRIHTHLFVSKTNTIVLKIHQSIRVGHPQTKKITNLSKRVQRQKNSLSRYCFKIIIITNNCTIMSSKLIQRQMTPKFQGILNPSNLI